MGAIRNHLGQLEDRFLSTIFLGSGLLFLATLFVTCALAQGCLASVSIPGSNPSENVAFRALRASSHGLMQVIGMKMEALNMFATSTIGLRTGVLPRSICYLGFTLGLSLLIIVADWAWISLVFPFWISMVNVWILYVQSKAHPPTLLHDRNDTSDAGVNSHDHRKKQT